MATSVYKIFSEHEYQANERLRAAAPKMYKELKHLVEFVDNAIKNQPELWYSTGHLKMLIERMGVKELLAQIDGEAEHD